MMENENYLQQSEGMHLGESSDISLSASADNDTHQAVVEMNNDPEVVVIAEGTTEIAPNEYKERVNLKEVRLIKTLKKKITIQTKSREITKSILTRKPINIREDNKYIDIPNLLKNNDLSNKDNL